MSLPQTSAFLVRPLGPVHFGPPRSFCAGEAHRSRSLFPPPPSTFQGLIRSQILRASGLDFQQDAGRIEALVGPPDRLPYGWQIEGPFPAQVRRAGDGQRLEPWLPAPLFLLRQELGAGRARLLRARPLTDAGVLTPAGKQDALPLRCGGATGARGRTLVGRPDLPGLQAPAGGWLNADRMLQLLRGERPHWCLEGRPGVDGWAPELPPFVRYELQPGLALERERHGAVQHGMLYFLERLRFREDVGASAGLYGRLRVGASDAQIPAQALTAGVGMAGRKGVAVAFEAAPEPVESWQQLVRGAHLPEAVSREDRFWLVLSTPARPESLYAPVRQGVLPAGVRLVVESCLAGRPEALGGLRIQPGGRPEPRPNRLFLPGGSAWLFRLEGGTAEERAEALRRLHAGHPLGPAREAAFGYGFTWVGSAAER